MNRYDFPCFRLTSVNKYLKPILILATNATTIVKEASRASQKLTTKTQRVNSRVQMAQIINDTQTTKQNMKNSSSENTTKQNMKNSSSENTTPTESTQEANKKKGNNKVKNGG